MCTVYPMDVVSTVNSIKWWKKKKGIMWHNGWHLVAFTIIRGVRLDAWSIIIYSHNRFHLLLLAVQWLVVGSDRMVMSDEKDARGNRSITTMFVLQFVTSSFNCSFVQIQCCRNRCHVTGHSTRSQSFSQANDLWSQRECNQRLENGHHSNWTKWFLFGLLLSTESREIG